MLRHKFLSSLSLAAALIGALGVGAGAQAPAPLSGGLMTPVRPPATPLIVRSPYVSTWQDSDALPGNWSKFWAGGVRAITGIARVDNQSFVFLGAPRLNGQSLAPLMTQTALQVTPTQSRYTLQGGGVTLSLDFLSPVEANDLRRLSMPFGYIFASAQSSDGKPHQVSLYFDITGEWAHGDQNALITWKRQEVKNGTQAVTAFTATASDPKVLGEVNEYPMWGTAVWATATQPGLTTAAGADEDVRGQVVSNGKLDGSVDSNQPRAINDHWPVFGLNFDLGRVGKTASRTETMVLGDVRDPAVSYLTKPVPPLWKAYWPDWQQMLAFAYGDADAARTRADRLDQKVTADATAAGGAKYAALCALALRQSFGATEMVGTADKPWMFMKEISSDGNISTVDVIYPAFPVFLYANPQLVRLQLDPLFDYAETGGWPKEFAEHDIGSSYPNANGHNDGKEEDMPVEESANMLIMAAAYMRYAPKAEAAAYAKAHYKILKQWADYEVKNGLDPEFQNQTDDFTGSIKSSANLALKGILGVGAMGQIAGFAGEDADAAHYSQTAKDMIGQWAKLAQSKTGDHLVLAYGQDDTWSLKYNAFPDKVLGLNLVPQSVLQEEARFYKTRENAFGIPLDPRHTYTKADWEIWTAASTDDAELRQDFVNEIYKYVDTSNFRGAFSDWYDTVSGQQKGFVARPVIGGIYAILDRTALKPGK